MRSQTSRSKSTYRRTNGSKVYNSYSVRFDPILFMKSAKIECSKYHYSVPENYSTSESILTITADETEILLFNIEGQEYNKQQNLNKLRQKIKVSDIYGFTYGSFSTRFWMLKIGIN